MKIIPLVCWYRRLKWPRKKHKKKQVKAVKQRNPIALNPLLRKCDTHEKSKKAKRKDEKMKLKRELKKLSFSIWQHIISKFR